MDTVAKTIQNNALGSASGAPHHVLNSIRKASRQTGVNFAYLMKQASVESSFNPSAKAKTSSATGLYQFIESTWLGMVKKHGAKYGMAELASKIDDHGRVGDRSVRSEILALRKDPEKASALAAELANENRAHLEKRWGGAVGATELYFAHFMGAGGAAEFLKARDENPLQTAAVLFPEAARSNRNVFYDARTGRARSMDEVYSFFDRKFDIKDSIPDVARGALEAPADAKASAGRPAGAMVFLDAPRESIMPRMSGYSEYQRAFHGMYNQAPAYRIAGTGLGFGNGLGGGSYGNMLANPVELMMLSQLAMPGETRQGYND